jgi:peptide/nickel transport system ATP-binding protein
MTDSNSPALADGRAVVLEARGLGKSYRARRAGAGVAALRDVNLTVCEGETVGIVGESGSGKSTLARLLIALDTPTEGEVRYRGRLVSHQSERRLREFRRKVQMVFQDPMGSLDPRMRVGEILAEPLRALGLNRADEKATVAELLAAVALPAEASRSFPHQFSGGQRQRIAIARTLGPRPEVLIADEPVSALDVSVRAQILNLLTQLVRDYRLTLLFISHDMAVVRHLCDRVVVIYRGQVVEDGPTEQIYEDPQHEYTKSLLAAVPRMSAPVLAES